MNQTELLDQFVIEARDCLEAIGNRLLQVERDPQNAELLNDLFRSVHTLKGNCGLFDFKPLERVVHAGEDLLDRVRNGSLAYGAELADALLEAMDYSARLIDEIEQTGAIAPGAGDLSAQHAAALRALLDGGVARVAEVPAAPARPAPAPGPSQAASVRGPGAPAGATAGRQPDHPAPAWLDALDPALRAAHPCAVALHYVPEPGCFFKGEDPWRLASTAPGLLAIKVRGHQAWPTGQELAEWDCYQCNLEIVLLSSAPQAYLEEHFRCVIEQVSCHVPVEVVAAPGLSEAAAAHLLMRAGAIWADQVALLSRRPIAPGTVLSARRTLRNLLAWTEADDLAGQALDALPDSASAEAVLGWARPFGPAGSPAEPQDPGAGLVSPELDDPLAASSTPESTRRGDEAGANAHHKVLKVAQEKVDRLMDLIGEMVVAKNSLPYLAQRAEEVFQQRELAREIKAQYTVINRIAEDMQHAIMQVRMLPVGTVFQRFGRLVRDISRKLGKQVQLVIEGEDTEADKNVIEPLADPLIHIIRNSLDHGICMPEVRVRQGKPAMGTIRIVARQESDRVIIEISDDGAGVDPDRVREKAVQRGLIPADRAASLSDDDAVQLIFLPGFSTAEAISDLSGRGVGMDVVRNAVERINGSVQLSSVKGRGMTVRLSLPLSMAVTNVMVVECAGRRFGVPMDLIVETVRVHVDDVHSFKQSSTTVLRGRIVALRALNDLLDLGAEPIRNGDGELAVLVVRYGAESVGLLVDHFHGASDIILKPLEGVLSGLTAFAGTALMGDGGVLMVLNPKELLS